MRAGGNPPRNPRPPYPMKGKTKMSNKMKKVPPRLGWGWGGVGTGPKGAHNGPSTQPRSPDRQDMPKKKKPVQNGAQLGQDQAPKISKKKDGDTNRGVIILARQTNEVFAKTNRKREWEKDEVNFFRGQAATKAGRACR